MPLAAHRATLSASNTAAHGRCEPCAANVSRRRALSAAYTPCPLLTPQALRAKGGTPQGVVKHAGATMEQLRIRTLCVAFLCVQVGA